MDSTATVAARPCDRREATELAARAIRAISQPPKMSPYMLASAGMAVTRMVGSRWLSGASCMMWDMPQSSDAVLVHATDDGVLVLGSESALAALDAASPRPTRSMTPTVLSTVSTLLGGASAVQATSGRYIRLDAETADFIKRNGVSLENLTSGVIRAKDTAGGSGGAIAKHLTFEKAALVTPASAAALAAAGTKMAIEKMLEEIQDYLEVIDAKLDMLLEQHRTAALGRLGGVALTIDEATALNEQTGTVSAVTWSKVQANAIHLSTLQVESVEQLRAIARQVEKHKGDPDRTAQLFPTLHQDISFWLGIIAQVIRLEERQALLELARVEEAEPDQLDDHRVGISRARADREARLAEALRQIMASTALAAELSNAQRVVNPLSAPRAVRGVNSVRDEVVLFAERVDVPLGELEGGQERSWTESVRGLAKDSASAVDAARAKGISRAKGLTGRLQERRERSILSKAEKIRSRGAEESQGQDGD